MSPEAARGRIVVTAKRSATPVARQWLLPGAFVAGVGATHPDRRELTLAGTGDVCLRAPNPLLAAARIEDLSDVANVAADPPVP